VAGGALRAWVRAELRPILFRSGRMTYLAPRYASRITPPPAAIVEPVAGGGVLLLATEKRFSMDNPAIQAALDPIEDLAPPRGGAHLRRRRDS
jgi:hypothetical protein